MASVAPITGHLDRTARVDSVTGDTPVVFIECGALRYALIGDWIDGCFDKAAQFDDRLIKAANQIYLDDDVLIPTTDYAGNVSWGRVTAMSRHDPGDSPMYRIRTASGRAVTITESKSMLVWHPDIGEFREVPAPEIRVGDFVPITKTLAAPPATVHTSSGWVQGHAVGRDLAMSASTAVVLPEYFASPMSFVCGLINGFLSMSSTDDGDVHTVVCNGRLSEGIAMLCTRFGVHCVLTDAGLRIDPSAQNCMRRSNDVILDAIVDINKIVAAGTEKVYDLAVPSTHTFGLANGLHVHSTSEVVQKTGSIDVDELLDKKLATIMERLDRVECAVRTFNSILQKDITNLRADVAILHCPQPTRRSQLAS